jgi:hypothetical protein
MKQLYNILQIPNYEIDVNKLESSPKEIEDNILKEIENNQDSTFYNAINTIIY